MRERPAKPAEEAARVREVLEDVSAADEGGRAVGVARVEVLARDRDALADGGVGVRGIVARIEAETAACSELAEKAEEVPPPQPISSTSRPASP